VPDGTLVPGPPRSSSCTPSIAVSALPPIRFCAGGCVWDGGSDDLRAGAEEGTGEALAGRQAVRGVQRSKHDQIDSRGVRMGFIVRSSRLVYD
jgi:hypothetical protein